MSDDKKEEMDRISKLMSSKAEELAMECGLDSVQIIATYLDPDDINARVGAGHGSIYQRFGAVSCWCRMTQSYLCGDPDE